MATGRGPIVLTGGDPAGVAPELVLDLIPDLDQAASGPNPHSVLYFATAGDLHIEQFLAASAERGLPARVLGMQDANVAGIVSAAGVSIVDVRELCSEVPGDYEPRAGEPDAAGGSLAFAALKAACDLATARIGPNENSPGAADRNNRPDAGLGAPPAGIVTAPLSKEWVARGGQADFRGHTEYLAARFERDVIMLMHGERFSVIPLTVHIALSEVPQALKRRMADPALPRLLEQVLAGPAYNQGRVALCGLNPHCGDGGLFGREDQEFIADWCEAMRERGIPLDGPLPADTLFTEGVRDRYRLILSCYHDQGLIPFKALEGHAGVNATIGLPLVRTSPDHGTAFDIAGRGVAQAESLRAAFRVIARGELSGF
ncbi:MAG: 4-hydroxythreonine-4-phosphate dehydrogenase PdxA [bacterium]|nr:4-hydroxythreonine-4-phosphate dehydrogenase PdxA [bacterium]